MTINEKAVWKLLTRLHLHGAMTFSEATRFFSKFPRGAYQAARKKAESDGLMRIEERPNEVGTRFESIMHLTEKGLQHCKDNGWIKEGAE